MALDLLLPPDAAAEMLHTWPTEPRLHHRTDRSIEDLAPLELLDEHIDQGVLYPQWVAAVQDGKAAHPGRFSLAADVRPGGLRKLVEEGHAYAFGAGMRPGGLRRAMDDGHTVNLRHIHRTVIALGRFARQLQAELATPNYLSAIISPPARQGLTHHWDQFTGLIVQMAGVKRWPVWQPEVVSPLGTYLDSPQVCTPQMLERWRSTEPYAEFELHPGDTLVLPRGWVHSPYCVGEERSYHLTVALLDRTPLWLAEQLLITAVQDPAFRATLTPAQLDGQLPDTLERARKLLVEHLQELPLEETLSPVREAAVGPPS